MKKLFLDYFTHYTIVLMCLLFFILFYFITNTGLLIEHYLWVFLPIVFAPFYEWFAHKFLLHAELKKQGFSRTMMLQLHYNHHDKPKEVAYLFAPWWSLIIHFFQSYLIFSLITWSFDVAVVPFTAGILYFLWYEWVHLTNHSIGYQPKTKIGEKLKQHHMLHHFYNDNKNWGITNYLADQLFGTKIQMNKTERSINIKIED